MQWTYLLQSFDCNALLTRYCQKKLTGHYNQTDTQFDYKIKTGANQIMSVVSGLLIYQNLSCRNRINLEMYYNRLYSCNINPIAAHRVSLQCTQSHSALET